MESKRRLEVPGPTARIVAGVVRIISLFSGLESSFKGYEFTEYKSRVLP